MEQIKKNIQKNKQQSISIHAPKKKKMKQKSQSRESSTDSIEKTTDNNMETEYEDFTGFEKNPMKSSN